MSKLIYDYCNSCFNLSVRFKIGDIKGCKKYLYKYNKEHIPRFDVDGFFVNFDTQKPFNYNIIWLKKWDENCLEDLLTLVHETLHCASHFADTLGIVNEEFVARMQEDLIKNFLQNLGKLETKQ